MIAFDFLTQFSSSNPGHWVALALLLAVGILQVLGLVRANVLNRARWRLRLGLNLLLWLVLLAFVLRPVWISTSAGTQVLLAADNVPGTYLRYLRDSLPGVEVLSPADFQEEIRYGTDNRLDSVTLVGQDFPTGVLSQLSQRQLGWIPYPQPNQPMELHWKAILRKGERQVVTGLLQADQPQVLALRYAGTTLDSTQVPAGTSRFRLEFPVFSLGRVVADLQLGEQVLGQIRYFSRPAQPMTVHFLLDTPDFESKTLADWLGQQGHRVRVTATISRDMTSSLSINKPAAEAPDLVITDPAHAGQAPVKKALAEGKSVFFINLTEPEAELPSLNRTLGSTWKVRKLSNEKTVPVGTLLTALPYAFTEHISQKQVPELPAAVQRVGAGRVGVSLLSETYPLRLSGDTLAYARLWGAVLAEVRPPADQQVVVEAPFFQNEKSIIRFNGFRPAPAAPVRLGSDTLSLAGSPLNAESFVATYRPQQPGWQPLTDSLELYVEDSTSWGSLAQHRQLINLLRSQQMTESTLLTTAAPRRKENRVPGWLWLVLVVGTCTLVWAEPRWA
jgi:hypothetical protein